MDTHISAASAAAQNTDPVEQGVAIDAITKRYVQSMLLPAAHLYKPSCPTISLPYSNMANALHTPPFHMSATNFYNSPCSDIAPSHDAPSTLNDDSFMENNNTSFAVNDAPPPDINPAGPTPVEEVTEGMPPVSDFIPKDAPNHSHPTPPPDRPLGTGEADGDVAMVNGDSETQPTDQPQVELAPAPAVESQPVQSSESSLVRPREDDAEDDGERAAKRSRVEMDASVDAEFAQPEVAQPESAVPGSLMPVEANADRAMSQPAEAASLPAADESLPESVIAPAQTTTEAAQASAPAEMDAPADAAPQTAAQAVENDAQPSIEPGSTPAPADSTTAPRHSTTPMTEPQKRTLVEKMKNLKKTKHSLFFVRPVDPLALNIPTYHDVIKNPMDLGTMDQKLKSNQYGSVQDFVDDFNLIISNTMTFNGPNHAVTQAGMSMKAYFDKMMESIPGPDQVAAKKASHSKRSSPAARAPQRQARQPAAPAAMPVAKSETFALQQDGVPQVRRESNGRPARAIKPPANRDIPYAKPKRKQHQLELRFCEHVLDELRSPKYGQVNAVFLLPVDPVALNIPHYRQIVKHPMDLSTMAQKLKQGQYGKANEFKSDFELIVSNCKAFNPIGNPVRDMAIQLHRYFEELWEGKAKWERQNKPQSARGGSTSDDEDSDADEEDDDEPPEDEKEQTIQALQKQLADMQNMLAGMAPGAAGAKARSHKKRDRTKDSKRSSKIGSMSSAPKSRPSASRAAPKKAAKPKKVTYEEKQEISEAVGRMNDSQVQELTKIITDNCDKYQGQDEMELEIDDLPSEVQLMLLRYTRKLFGKPKSAAEPMSPLDDGEMEDDDFEPSERVGGGGGAAQKRKKHKPMSKREQQERINALSSKLEQFKNPGTSGSESPAGGESYGAAKAEAESSGDDESEESEEE